jgi:ABC-2 type transport system ATP-binding protein
MSAIAIRNISKKFKRYHDKSQTLKEKLLFRSRSYYEDQWVLNDISFEVEKGEAIGIIGENGSGKSTLLKLLTRIMYPDSGSIEIQGRVSSLIELGAGFHPDMTGRENIYINASIFGLTKKEIDGRLRRIIAFSELEDFIDNPVRTYSSGMYMRLAFAIAINVDAEVLLVDEILAVGDAAFQAKCNQRMREIKAKGTTIVIVSHSLDQIEQLCERSLWIHSGEMALSGSPGEVHPRYLEYMGRKGRGIETTHGLPADEVVKAAPTRDTAATGALVREVKLLDRDMKERDVFRTGEALKIRIDYQLGEDGSEPVISIGIHRGDGLLCFRTDTAVDKFKPAASEDAKSTLLVIHEMNLLPGEYSLSVGIHSADGLEYAFFEENIGFRLYSEIQDAGIVRLNHSWEEGPSR